MKTGRNDPCHCGSGQKYKKCCLDKDAAAKSAELEKLAAEAAQAAQAAAEAEEAADDAPAGGKAATSAPRPNAGAVRQQAGAGPQPSPIRRKAV